MRRRFLVVAASTLASAGATQAAPWTGSDQTATILVGGTAPLSGPASEYYAPVAKGAQAYIAYVNAHGGVYGRRIEYKIVDDAYDPARTAQETRKLVEQDQVLAIFNSVGTEHALTVRPYLNQVGVPQLFVGTGARKIIQARKQYPWTLGYFPSFYGEGALYGRYIAAHSPTAKVAVLYENDDYGKELRDGLQKSLHGRGMIAGIASYEPADAEVSAQIASLKATHANTLALFAGPQQSIQAFLAAQELGWQPHWYVSAVSIDPSLMNEIALSTSKTRTEGVIGSTFLKVATDPRLTGDRGAKLYKSIMKSYCDGCDPNALAHIYGMAAAYTMVDALTHAGKNPSRASLLRAATHLIETSNPFLQPGITLKTSATDYAPFEQLRMLRYHNGRWNPFGTMATVRP
jgi:branched-chain amino acid transport system substrate-binding protein